MAIPSFFFHLHHVYLHGNEEENGVLGKRGIQRKYKRFKVIQMEKPLPHSITHNKATLPSSHPFNVNPFIPCTYFFFFPI